MARGHRHAREIDRSSKTDGQVRSRDGNAYASRHADATIGSQRGLCGGDESRFVGEIWGCAFNCCGANTSGPGSAWRDRHLSPRGPPFQRQADRSAYELCEPGRYRHREHAPPQRAARVAATADRDFRRAQGHQPLGVPPAGRARALVESAARLCEAERGSIWRPRGTTYHLAASYGHSEEWKSSMRQEELEAGRGSITGRVRLDATTVHVHVIQADPEFVVRASIAHGTRTTLGVPLLREGMPIRVIVMSRNVGLPFTDKQIELVTTFADQR